MQMTRLKAKRGSTHSRSRRQIIAALLLVPIAGCQVGNPIRGLRRLNPWPSASVEPEERVVNLNVQKPKVHTVSHRTAARPELTIASASDIINGRDLLAKDTNGLAPPIELNANTIAPATVDTDPTALANPQQIARDAHLRDTQLRDVPLPEPIESSSISMTEQTIDLGSALGMAGANAWTIQLARQRTVEAHADLLQARALWLPTLQLGVGWNKHDGRVQASDGNVIEASRNSLFVGGGATFGAPVAGGSGGPFRLFADLALADAFFEPKIASRNLSAENAGVFAAKAEALRDAGVAYVDLVEAAGQVADAQAAIDAATELLHLTETFAKAGAGAQADVDRAATEKTRLSQRLQDAKRNLRVRSAGLSRRLRLDPRFSLHPADQVIVPIELDRLEGDVNTYISTALCRRPEIIELSHRIAGLCLAVKKAQVEPWIPSVTMAASGGSFGGGQGSNLDNQASRSDVDLQAIWQLDSMGLGVAANRTRAGSQLQQQRIEMADLKDAITAEVVQAYENVQNYRSQIATAEDALAKAEASYQRNLKRIRADEGLPIELLQAIVARAGSLADRTAAVSNYNRAQLELLFAIGQLRP